MEFIHVTSGKQRTSSLIDADSIIYKFVKNCLFSLIAGLKGTNLGLKSLADYTYQLGKYASKYLSNITKYADSGGYSILKGDVEPKDICLFIESYFSFFENDQMHYDYIFSLDIPFSARYEQMNNKDIIYKYNKISLEKQIEVISRHNHLKNKVFFVWQFKTRYLYEIWRRLVDELSLNRIIKNRAIGGMVSLRKNAKINFSPFTAIAYRCLQDYLMEYDDDRCFRLHFLGINLMQDRFHIIFLEKLYKRYLTDCKIIFTYDSIGYVQRVRVSKYLYFYDFTDDKKLMFYPNIELVPAELIKKVYLDSDKIEFINGEIERRKSNKELKDIDSFVPLNIYSNLKIDAFFDYIIDQYELIDQFTRSYSITVIDKTVGNIMKNLSDKYPDVFKPDLVSIINENIEYLAIYHNWFMKTRNPMKLEYHIQEFINSIGLPEILV